MTNKMRYMKNDSTRYYNHPEEMPLREQNVFMELQQIYEPLLPPDSPLLKCMNWVVFEKQVKEMSDEELGRLFGNEEVWGTFLGTLLLRKKQIFN